MRSLDGEKTAQAMIDGMRIYCNFITSDAALDGKTPGEKVRTATEPTNVDKFNQTCN